MNENINRKTIILVGSTGNGKSTLGSFLYDSYDYDINPIFPRANSLQPKT